MIAKRWAGFLMLAATAGLLYYYALKVAVSETRCRHCRVSRVFLLNALT